MRLMEVRRKIADALEAARMTQADFGADTEFIKERTKLFRETWIIPELESVLTEVDREIDKHRQAGKYPGRSDRRPDL